MSEELLINVSPMESRVAVLDNGVLSEVYIERHNKLGLVGNIYLGTVVRVLPGMQAAFVDIGQSRTAFLHVNDMQRLPRSAPTLTGLLDVRVNQNNQPTVLSQVVEDNAVDANKSNKTNATNATKIDVEIGSDSNSYSNHNSNHNNNNDEVSKSLDINYIYTAGATKNDPNDGSVKDVHKNRPLSPSPLAMRERYAAQADESENPVNDFSVNDSLISKRASNDSSLEDLPEQVGNAITQAQATSEVSEIIPAPKKRNVPVPQQHTLIQYRLHEGQRILVQVTKDQLGTKGARLTTNISLPSRYLVYLPSSEHIGISQRIDNEDERHRLKSELEILMQTVDLKGGLIARTAAERVPVHKLEEDIYYLLQLWRTIQARSKKARLNSAGTPSVMIYQELSLPLRSIRDLVHQQTQRIIVDNEDMYHNLRAFAKEFVPFVYDRITAYSGEQPLFDIHRVEEDLKDALKRRVDLKSGGYLIIDQTEAMTTIDVNTGSFVGGRSLEDTVYKTNLEATHAIARQLRLRNLGGIIILDFIDMLEQEHKDDVLDSLQQQLALDYAKTNITQVSDLGLIEMTRKRTRESLEQQLCEPCKTCQGRGFVKTAETVCFEIFREIVRCARTYNAPKKFTVVAHAEVIDLLLSSEADTVADLEYLVGRVITFEVESLYTQEQYDIVLD